MHGCAWWMTLRSIYISATQQLHRIIMEQKNEINDLKTRRIKILR
jgi:hypothetical protein